MSPNDIKNKKYDNLKMNNKTMETIKFISALVMLVAGIVLAFISLYLPPEGVIDSSVLMFVGEIFVFVGSVWHIYNYTNIQLKKLERRE